MSKVRCLQCGKILAIVRPVIGEPVYEAKEGNFSHDGECLHQTCGRCGERYEIRRQGPGWALIGRTGSKIFE